VMPSVPLFVELCAGTAALSLRLHRRSARPPVSRMGAKTGYADAILRVLGLRPGQGAAHYLWCEPDPGVRLLLEAYRDPDLAREAASIIRGWADEDPRALWERLRAEGPPRGVDAGEVARWMQTRAWCFRPGVIESGFRDPYGGFSGAAKDRGCEGGTDGLTCAGLASRADTLPALPATITPDARRVDPREVARWLVRATWSYEQGNIRTGFVGPGDRRQDTTATATATERAGMGLPATITPDARGIEPGVDLPAGTVAYMDPPYVGTTGYGHDLPRADVVALARRWAAAGATVAISEAEPVDDLTADGWSAVNITGQRVGQARTFSRQQAEWLTLSRPPAWTPSEQCGLFG
jgi:hypothetical protein